MTAHPIPHTCNTIGQVQIIYDSHETVESARFADFMANNGYIVQYQDISSNSDILIAPQSDKPTFLIGVGRAGNAVQNLIKKDGAYAGGISIMSHVSWLHRFGRAHRFIFGRHNAPDTPLLMIGGWGILQHLRTFSCTTADDDKLSNLNVLIYPDISFTNMWLIAQDEILNFMNNKRHNAH